MNLTVTRRSMYSFAGLIRTSTELIVNKVKTEGWEFLHNVLKLEILKVSNPMSVFGSIGP